MKRKVEPKKSLSTEFLGAPGVALELWFCEYTNAETLFSSAFDEDSIVSGSAGAFEAEIQDTMKK